MLDKNKKVHHRIECTSCDFHLSLTDKEYKDIKKSRKAMDKAIKKHHEVYKDCKLGKLFFNSI